MEKCVKVLMHACMYVCMYVRTHHVCILCKYVSLHNIYLGCYFVSLGIADVEVSMTPNGIVYDWTLATLTVLWSLSLFVVIAIVVVLLKALLRSKK